MEKKNIWNFKEENYGPFLSYVKDKMVTDINYNGRDTWIDHLEKGRYKADIVVTADFINQFSARLANAVSANFNKNDNLLEAETNTLRISIVHESVTNTGRSISIRKTEPIRRLNKEIIRKTNYCSEETLMFLENAVHAHLNIIMCGLPGSGKTELLKYLTKFIADNERVITIEDNLEIHYSEINSQKDCVEMKVNEKFFDYTKAIKACLRQNPRWIMLSEARSVEVKYLLEALSTGTHCLTTLHTDDVRKVPDRIQNMMKDSFSADRMENDIYSFVDLGILLNKKTDQMGAIRRYIDQICIFDRDEQKGINNIVMVVQDGKIISREIPENIWKKFHLNNIQNPFVRGGCEN
ncbi:ATPase, T2SS/T4P/T4SS family [Robinsoniella peoriensis]